MDKQEQIEDLRTEIESNELEIEDAYERIATLKARIQRAKDKLKELGEE